MENQNLPYVVFPKENGESEIFNIVVTETQTEYRGDVVRAINFSAQTTGPPRVTKWNHEKLDRFIEDFKDW